MRGRVLSVALEIASGIVGGKRGEKGVKLGTGSSGVFLAIYNRQESSMS